MSRKAYYKQFILSSFTALILGSIFIAAIPIIILLAADILITFAVFLDPLHQGKYIEIIWGAFIEMVIIQIIVSIIASLITGVVIGFFTINLKTGWVYALGMFASLIVYGVIQSISLIPFGFLYGELVVFLWAVITLPVVVIFSLIIGSICVGINRKFGV